MSDLRESYIRRGPKSSKTVDERLAIRRELDDAVDRSARIYRETLLRKMAALRALRGEGGVDG